MTALPPSSPTLPNGDANLLPHLQPPVAPDTQSSPYRDIVRPGGEQTPDGLPAGTLPGDEKDFVPEPDRWKYRFPEDARYRKGHWYDPFNRNKLKGDVPIFGNRTFLNLNFVSTTFVDGRQLPTPSNVPSERPGSSAFFGKFGQLFLSQNLAFTAELFHGDTSFRPPDWRIRITPEENVNYFATRELGIVNADPSAGTTRFDTHLGLQEGFVEVKLKDLSSEYDFVSARAGVQSFNSDFRGFIFSDQEPGLRLFGTLDSNRYEFNVAGFAMLEKDTNSGLNRFKYRNQNVFIANLYRQDFFRHGYTIQASVHYDKDDASLQYDRNNFLVRPAPVGSVQPHEIRAVYFGLTGDGHIGRLNLTHAFYEVLGSDSLNPIAGIPVRIKAQMAAAELSWDRDWLRYRVSFFYASGDRNPQGHTAGGFDGIFDNPNFAGGIFSFWNREGLRLTGSGVALDSPDSLLPGLRSSKTEGQANYVNPGLFLYNSGVDADVTPRLRAFLNLNLIRFANTESLEFILFQQPIHVGVGADSGIGFTYRPRLSENISVTSGLQRFFSHFRVSATSTRDTLFLPYSPALNSGFDYMTYTGKVLIAVVIALARAPSAGAASDPGCISCHGQTDSATMHTTGTVRLTCTECHGGNGSITRPAGSSGAERSYREAKANAHPRPRLAALWKSSANPVRPGADWLKEDREYIRFVNHWRSASGCRKRCGTAQCHAQEVRAVGTSMMTHGAMLWGAALYNNGSFPLKRRSLRGKLFAFGSAADSEDVAAARP